MTGESTTEGEREKSGLSEAVASVGQAIDSLAEAMKSLSESIGRVLQNLDEVSTPVQGSSHSSSPPVSRNEHRVVRVSKIKTASRNWQGLHGGPRRASISRGVDDLIRTGWLVRRSQREVVSKLQERFPGANSDNALHVLKRRLNKSLVRVKEGKDWVWSTIEKKS
jgi:formyltetrahydrofolate synthetase